MCPNLAQQCGECHTVIWILWVEWYPESTKYRGIKKIKEYRKILMEGWKGSRGHKKIENQYRKIILLVYKLEVLLV